MNSRSMDGFAGSGLLLYRIAGLVPDPRANHSRAACPALVVGDAGQRRNPASVSCPHDGYGISREVTTKSPGQCAAV
jgi:hypothetical protein